MKQSDGKQFVQAMAEEIAAHTNSKHWKLILKSQVPHGRKHICESEQGNARSKSVLKRSTSGRLG